MIQAKHIGEAKKAAFKNDSVNVDVGIADDTTLEINRNPHSNELEYWENGPRGRESISEAKAKKLIDKKAEDIKWNHKQ